MIERIVKDNKLYSIIMRTSYVKDGIDFVTNQEDFLQIGYMNRESGYKIQPHKHNEISRTVSHTQEVLIIKSGKVQVDYYDTENTLFKSVILNKGDLVFLAFGGHGFSMLEKSEIIEVKQGPYIGESDKTRF